VVALTIGHNIAECSPYPAELTLWDVAAGTPLREPWLVPEEAENFGSLALLDGQLVAIRGRGRDRGGRAYGHRLRRRQGQRPLLGLDTPDRRSKLG
jgi:hypothetical protein